MNRHVLGSSIFAVSMASLVGCGGSSGGGGITPAADSGTNGSQDSGVNTFADSGMGSPDSTVSPQDSGMMSADSALPGDATMPVGDGSQEAGDAGADASITPPTGTPVVLGDNLNLWGVTGDGFAIYSDETAGTLFALSLTSTTPVPLATSLNGDAGAGGHFISVSHNVVFIAVEADASQVGTLSVWTSGAATPTVVSTSTRVDPAFGGFVYASSDSSLIAFIDNFDGNALTGNFRGATVTGGSPKTLATGIDFTGTAGGGACDPAGRFAGTSYFVALYCTTADTAVTVSTYHGTASWNELDLSTTVANAFSLDTAGTQVAFSDASGLEVSPVSSKALKLIDAKGTVGGTFNAAGTSILYAATDGTNSSLATSPIAAPAPATLAAGILGVYGLSPNGQTVLGFETSDGTLSDGTDMWLASATTAGAATQLGTSTTATPNGDLFTADSSHVLVLDFFGTNPAFDAFPVAGNGMTPLVLSDNPGFNLVNPAYFATTASKVVFTANPNFTAQSNEDGVADIMAADTAGAAAPTTLVNQANADFFLSPAKDKIVYVWSNTPGAHSGLYITAAP